ncbi:MAG TPA: BamA/TamA family outer membrane protein [Longimicrobiales bacterium]|nr:BamA/TamA family outer membrane protein [Longimicrobiales bacterium]
MIFRHHPHLVASPIPLAVVLLTAASAAAQEADPGVCPSGRVEHIFIDNHSIFDTSDPDLDPRFRWAYSAANRLHVRTRDGVIERELLFATGDCFDPVLLEESERLLRGHPFIARADIYGLQQPGGGYHVVVDTEDEWSTQVEVRADLAGGFELKGLDLREQNLAGTGRELGLFYRSDEAVRTYGARYRTPQFLGTRWDMQVALGKTRTGNLIEQQISYPFLGEVGGWGFRQLLTHQDRLFDYILPRGHSACPEEGPDCRVLVPVRERGFHAATLRRAGRRGNLTVFGGGFSFQEVGYPGEEITLVEGGRYEDRAPAPPELSAEAGERMEPLRNIRGVVLLGKRNIVWQQRRGLDSFRGEEDVRIGAEVEVAFSRSIPALKSDNDLYGSLDLYAAAGPPSAFFATRLRADARRDYDAGPDEYEMKDVFAEGETFMYLRPGGWLARHTLLLRVAGAGGWHVRTPFQLTLGGERALRGWADEQLPGGRRLILTAEDRWYWGWPFPDVVDAGTSLFVDVGRIWPGDAPFGRDSGWRASVGAGLRANFPAGGRNTLRVDAAFPVGADGGLGKLQLLIGVGEYLGLHSDPTDPQFSRSRLPPITGNLLHFPR